MEEADLKKLREEHLLPDGDQLLDLLLGEAAELDAVDPPGEHHAPRGELQERRGDDNAPLRLRRHTLVEELLHPQGVQGLVPEIKLGVQALRKRLRERDVIGLVSCEPTDQRLRDICQAPEHVEVLGDHTQCPRALHLHRDLLARLPQRRPVDLRERRSRNRFVAEGGEHLADRPPQLRLDRPPGLARGERLDAVLQPGQLAHRHCRQHIGADGQHLPQLHKGRPQLRQVVHRHLRKVCFVLPEAVVEEGVKELCDKRRRDPEEAAPPLRELRGSGVPVAGYAAHRVDQRQPVLVSRVRVHAAQCCGLLRDVGLPIRVLRPEFEVRWAAAVLRRPHRLLQEPCACSE
mmetsp:Transcript_35714/g.106716  ORF Transcript_35714/g.106716 Transcript_35714/m.106716 type:complete len:347 (-) Transcript_35714:88-1128(-)